MNKPQFLIESELVTELVHGSFKFTEKWFEVKGYTLRGINSVTFRFASFLNGGQLPKERICSLGSKLFPLRVNPFLEVLFKVGKKAGNTHISQDGGKYW